MVKYEHKVIDVYTHGMEESLAEAMEREIKEYQSGGYGVVACSTTTSLSGDIRIFIIVRREVQ
jgi:hypothetical protein